MLPAEFYIEERLEKHRKTSFCNLGESGVRNFTVRQILDLCKLSPDALLSLSLEDSPNSGSLELKEEIASLYSELDPREILITTGTSEALYLFFRVVVKKGMRVGYFSPAFQALYEIPRLCGAELNPVDILEGKNFEKLFKNSDLIILNQPHNPTGIAFTGEDWEEIRYLNSRYDRILLFDEHYRFLDNSGESGFDRVRGRVFATGSITKSFGVTGLRVGWILGDSNTLSTLRSYKDYLTHTVNPMSEYLSLHLLKNRSSILSTIRGRVHQNISVFRKAFHLIHSLAGIGWPSGGLVSFPKLKKGFDSENYADKLLENCGVFVLPGKNFEKDGFIRVGFGENQDRFATGIERWVDWESRNANL